VKGLRVLEKSSKIHFAQVTIRFIYHVRKFVRIASIFVKPISFSLEANKGGRKSCGKLAAAGRSADQLRPLCLLPFARESHAMNH
jgi:hypothetical protein